MAKTLVLVRHGKAQPRANDKLDEARELTTAGRRALAACLPKAFALAAPSDLSKAQVWTSPAARTRQTAELVAKAVDLPAPISLQSLFEQDDRAFLLQVAASSATSIIAVGHNPFIERIIERLCGSRIACAPGAVASMYLPDALLDAIARTDTFDTSARLQWFVQGPQAKRWQTLVDIEDELARWMSRVEERLAAFLRDPDDIEHLHRLRVSIRTLRSHIAFVAPYVRKSQCRQISADLRDVVALTSRQRDRDVLCEQIARMEPCCDELLAFCSRERDAARAEVVRKLGSEKVAKTMFRTGRAVRNVAWRKDVSRAGVAADDLRARLASMLDDVAGQIDAIDEADMKRVHDVRKKAKAVRYVAENLGSAFGLDAAPVSAAMEETQNRLGAMCDAHVGMIAIDRIRRADLSEEACAALDALRAEYASALRLEADAVPPELAPAEE